jgi:hypothetical protein
LPNLDKKFFAFYYDLNNIQKKIEVKPTIVDEKLRIISFGKEYAYKCFLKIKLTEPLMECILSAIEEQKQSKLWQDRQYIPNPSTWLNQARWEDEITEDDKKPIASYGDANSFFESACKRTYEDDEDY